MDSAAVAHPDVYSFCGKFTDLMIKIAFWVTVAAVAILLGLSIYIGANHWNKLPAIKPIVSVTAFCLTSGFQVFFPVAFYLLFTPWFCDPQSLKLYVIQTPTDCFGSSNLVSIIFGTFSVICLLGLSVFSAFLKSSVEPVNNDFTVILSLLNPDH